MCQANGGGGRDADIPAGTRRPQNMYLHSGPTPCRPQDFQFQTVQNTDCFSSSNGREKFGCGVAQRKPAKVPFEITHETDSGDSGTCSFQMLLIHFKYETLVPQNITKCTR